MIGWNSSRGQLVTWSWQLQWLICSNVLSCIPKGIAFLRLLFLLWQRNLFPICGGAYGDGKKSTFLKPAYCLYSAVLFGAQMYNLDVRYLWARLLSQYLNQTRVFGMHTTSTRSNLSYVITDHRSWSLISDQWSVHYKYYDNNNSKMIILWINKRCMYSHAYLT